MCRVALDALDLNNYMRALFGSNAQSDFWILTIVFETLTFAASVFDKLKQSYIYLSFDHQQLHHRLDMEQLHWATSKYIFGPNLFRYWSFALAQEESFCV